MYIYRYIYSIIGHGVQPISKDSKAKISPMLGKIRITMEEKKYFVKRMRTLPPRSHVMREKKIFSAYLVSSCNNKPGAHLAFAFSTSRLERTV
jgi:hypothetical protein